MRIAILSPLGAAGLEGGAERVARAQAAALARRGHAVRLVAAGPGPEGEAGILRERLDGLEVRRLVLRPEERSPLELARPRVEALVEAAVEGSDLVHLHHWGSFSGGIVRRLAPGRPVVVTLHDAFAACPRSFRQSPDARTSCPRGRDLGACAGCLASALPGGSREGLRARLERRRAGFERELAAAARVLVPSRHLLNELGLSLELPRDRVVLLPHGLLRPLVRAPHPRREATRLCVLHFGHRRRSKGVLDLVRALVPLGRRARLVMLGEELEPGLDAELREEARGMELVLQSRYGLEELERAARGAHLAAFPSRRAEGYGLVLDEAVALGLRAWVSDRGALPERLAALGRRLGEPAGRVLPAEDPAAWTRAFRALVADGGILHDARLGAQRPLRSADDAARELELLYGNLLGRSRRRAS